MFAPDVLSAASLRRLLPWLARHPVAWKIAMLAISGSAAATGVGQDGANSRLGVTLTQRRRSSTNWVPLHPSAASYRRVNLRRADANRGRAACNGPEPAAKHPCNLAGAAADLCRYFIEGAKHV
jgi:hypothetical protein